VIDLRLHDLVVEQGKLLLQLLSVVREETDRAAAQGETMRIADRLFAGLDELYNGLRTATVFDADDTHGADGTDATAVPPPYAEIVEHVRAQVEHHVPHGGIVAVVSRGDSTLVDLPDRAGWHYPQNEVGTWAGFHPRNGADALAHLDGLHARGARYLAVPATSSWWLDWYGELAHFLEESCTTLVRDEKVTLFALPAGAGSPVVDLSASHLSDNEDRGAWAR
jgi:hypothetical protein